MPRLEDLPDINFVTIDKDKVEKEVFNLYYAITGRDELARGDPVRLFLLFITNLVILLLNKLDETGRMNLLKHSKDDYLDGIGALVGTTRLPAAGASAVIQITLSAEISRETIIPQGTRVATENNIYFAIADDVIIPAGETSAQVTAVCTQTGEGGNGFKPGEIYQIVDPVPYVARMVNISTSEGGTDTEQDDSLRERIFEAPESYSCAGSEGAYIYHAKSVSSAIIDAADIRPTPGVVKVIILLTGGVVPENAITGEVERALSAKTVRPLTDQLSVIPPEAADYQLNVHYWINDDADASAVSAKVLEAVEAYKLWQKTKLGRDINPDELIYKLKAINGVKRVKVISPEFTLLQKNQVAQDKGTSITLEGSEDE